MKYFRIALLITSQVMLWYGVNESLKTPYTFVPQNIAIWSIGAFIFLALFIGTMSDERSS